MFEDFEHPWLLLLFLLVLPLLIWRRSKYFLRHSYLKAMMGAKKIALINFLRLISWLLIILAAVDYGTGYKESHKKLIIHHYVLINDGSGSMVGDENALGVGKKLTILLKANDHFLKTLENLERPDGSKDFVGMLVFADDAFVVSYFVEDYDFIRQKMFQIDWRIAPLNLGTQTNKAIWASIKLILKNNVESGGDFFSDEELVNLEARFKGSGRRFSLENFYALSNKVSLIKEQIRGSSIIIFTDGIFPIDGKTDFMSVMKLVLFCGEMGIRPYLISVEAAIDPALLNLLKSAGGEGMIVSSFDLEKINGAYQRIINQQAGEYELIDRYQKKSYADWFAGAGLAGLLICIVLRNTVSRSLTEI